MKNYVIVSYYTLGTPYQEVAHEYLMNSVYQLKLKSDIRAVHSRGSWSANTSYKPEFIKSMLEAHEENVVFVDADAEVLDCPCIFESIPDEYDFAAHLLDRDAWYNRSYGEDKELLSGTLFVRNTASARKVVDMWADRCKSNVRTWEQVVLQTVLDDNNVKIFELPIEYCYINSLPNGDEPHVKCAKPVIVHHQASRKYKHLVH